MKKNFAFVVMYLAMSWWFFCTAIFFTLAGPANLLVKRLSEYVGADNGQVAEFNRVAGRFSVN